jgi:O-antigen/teichoic acid export membrane protein
MKQQFVSNIIILILVNLIIKPFYIFGIETEVQNIIGLQNYGLYFDYFNFVLLFQFINDPGLQNWNTQYVTGHREDIAGHIMPLFATKFLLGIVFLITIFLFGALFGHTQWWLLLFASINLFLSTVFLLIRSCISGLGYYRSDSVLSILDKLLMILTLGAILWLPLDIDLDINVFVSVLTLSYFLACVVALIILLSKTKINLKFKFSWNLSTSMLKEAYPFIWILILMTLYNRLDGVLLSSLIDDNHYQTGVYAVCYRFFDAANMIGYLFAALLFPMFSYHRDNKTELKSLSDLSIRYAFVCAVIICAIVFSFGAFFIKSLIDAYDPTFLTPLYLLISAYWCVAISYIYGTLMLSTGMLKHLNVIYIIALFTNVLLNLFLIPRYGATGAALTALITNGIVLILQVYFSYRHGLIYHESGTIFRAAIFLIAVALIFVSVKSITIIHPLVLCAGASILCGLVAILIKLIDIQSLQELVKSRAT